MPYPKGNPAHNKLDRTGRRYAYQTWQTQRSDTKMKPTITIKADTRKYRRAMAYAKFSLFRYKNNDNPIGWICFVITPLVRWWLLR